MFGRTGLLGIALAVGIAGAGCGKDETTNAAPKPAEAEAKREAEAPKPKVKPPATGEQRVAKVQACWKAFNAGDMKTFGACFTPNAIVEIVDGGPDMSGPALQVIGAFREAFPDLQGEQALIMVSGRKVITVDLMTGTHTGPLLGMAPTNKELGMWVAHVFDTNDQGVITKETAYLDQATLLGQLGAHRRPHRPAADRGTAGQTVIAIASGEPYEADIGEINTAYRDAFNDHDPQAMAEMFDEDAVVSDLVMPGDVTGGEGQAELVAPYFKAFPDVHCEQLWIESAQDFSAIAWECKGTNKGAAKPLGIPKATGKAAVVHGIDIREIKDGKITRSWAFYNGAALAKQLGLMK